MRTSRYWAEVEGTLPTEGPKRLVKVAAWEVSIQERARSFGVCRFIRAFGHEQITPLVERHDLQTGAHAGRPLA